MKSQKTFLTDCLPILYIFIFYIFILHTKNTEKGCENEGNSPRSGRCAIDDGRSVGQEIISAIDYPLTVPAPATGSQLEIFPQDRAKKGQKASSGGAAFADRPSRSRKELGHLSSGLEDLFTEEEKGEGSDGDDAVTLAFRASLRPDNFVKRRATLVLPLPRSLCCPTSDVVRRVRCSLAVHAITFHSLSSPVGI